MCIVMDITTMSICFIKSIYNINMNTHIKYSMHYGSNMNEFFYYSK